MGRVFNVALLSIMIVGAIVTYQMKHQAEMAAAEVARLEAETAEEKNRIALLKAEWSMLTQPGRIQSVVEKYADYFELQPFSPDQIGTIAEIPLRPVGQDGDASQALARLAAGGAAVR
ncbi:MAG: hypothetical protein WD036_01395 [Bauldia sp.]